LSNNEGAFKQTLIGYITAATDDYDRMFDGESFDANDYVDFIVFAKIRSLLSKAALPFDPSDTIQLGYSANFRVHLQ
jgi:propanediol dehydratase large subunit